MVPRDCRFLFFLCLMVSMLTSCGDIRPLWKGEVKLEDYTMYYSEPCEFHVDLRSLNQKTTVMLELVITYYVGTTRSNLPLFVVLEDKDHKLSEYTTKVVLKAEGEWLGIPETNEIDYTLTHLAIPRIDLEPGEYTLRIYANDEEVESLYGVVNITARFYDSAMSEDE